jgi:hypothetical protein
MHESAISSYLVRASAKASWSKQVREHMPWIRLLIFCEHCCCRIVTSPFHSSLFPPFHLLFQSVANLWDSENILYKTPLRWSFCVPNCLLLAWSNLAQAQAHGPAICISLPLGISYIPNDLWTYLFARFLRGASTPTRLTVNSRLKPLRTFGLTIPYIRKKYFRPYRLAKTHCTREAVLVPVPEARCFIASCSLWTDGMQHCRVRLHRSVVCITIDHDWQLYTPTHSTSSGCTARLIIAVWLLILGDLFEWRRASSPKCLSLMY